VKEYPENLRHYMGPVDGYVNQIDVKMLTGRQAVEAELQVSVCEAYLFLPPYKDIFFSRPAGQFSM
jgi:hypothetical protein